MDFMADEKPSGPSNRHAQPDADAKIHPLDKDKFTYKAGDLRFIPRPKK